LIFPSWQFPEHFLWGLVGCVVAVAGGGQLMDTSVIGWDRWALEMVVV
jgi:hypothetical protein